MSKLLFLLSLFALVAGEWLISLRQTSHDAYSEAAHAWWHTLPGGYAILGVLCCVGLVYFAKILAALGLERKK